MAKRGYTAEETITVLRQVEVALGSGKTAPQACREAGITELTYYRWRKEFVGLKLSRPSVSSNSGKRIRGLSAAALGGGGGGAAAVRSLGAPRMPSAVSVARYAALPADRAERRGRADPSTYRAGERVRAPRLSPDYGAAARGRSEGGQGSGGAHLADTFLFPKEADRLRTLVISIKYPGYQLNYDQSF
jgi:hypothetical protein